MLLRPDLTALVVDFLAGSEGPPVVLLEPIGCPVAFTAGCGRVERLSCLRITQRSENPIAIGAASRIVTHALMAEGDTAGAIEFASTEAATLDDAIARHSPDSLSIYGALLLRGAVAAGQAGDADAARTLLDEAERAGLRLGAEHNYQWTAFGPNNVIAHRIAIELALGNAGTAVDHYRSIRIDEMLVVERRAIVHMDLARAYTQWGKFDEAVNALRTTARIAPQELTRPVARDTIHHIDTLAPATVRTQLRELTATSG